MPTRLSGPAASCLAVLVLSAGPSARPAWAGLCDSHEVVDLVAAHYGRQSPHLLVLPDSAVEVRTLTGTGTAPGRVLCAVAVREGFADPEQGLGAALALTAPRYYEVERVGLGARVDFGGR